MTRDQAQALLAAFQAFFQQHQYPDRERAIEGILRAFTEPDRSGRAVMCEHANEVPQACPCWGGCYCKTHTCKEKSLWFDARPTWDTVMRHAKEVDSWPKWKKDAALRALGVNPSRVRKSSKPGPTKK